MNAEDLGILSPAETTYSDGVSESDFDRDRREAMELQLYEAKAMREWWEKKIKKELPENFDFDSIRLFGEWMVEESRAIAIIKRIRAGA